MNKERMEKKIIVRAAGATNFLYIRIEWRQTHTFHNNAVLSASCPIFVEQKKSGINSFKQILISKFNNFNE